MQLWICRWLGSHFQQFWFIHGSKNYLLFSPNSSNLGKLIGCKFALIFAEFRHFDTLMDPKFAIFPPQNFATLVHRWVVNRSWRGIVMCSIHVPYRWKSPRHPRGGGGGGEWSLRWVSVNVGTFESDQAILRLDEWNACVIYYVYHRSQVINHVVSVTAPWRMCSRYKHVCVVW